MRVKDIRGYSDLIDEIILTRNGEKCFVRFDGSVYQVGDTLYFVIETLKSVQYEEAVRIIQSELALDDKELEFLSTQVIEFFGSLRSAVKDKSYLYLRFSLIS